MIDMLGIEISYECVILLAGCGFLSFLVSFLFQRFLIRVARKNGFLDQPSSRKLHKKNRPNIGGIGIFLGFFSGLYALLLFCYFNASSAMHHYILTNTTFILLHFGAIFFIFILGVIDDISPIPVSTKLAIEWMVASVLFLIGFRIEKISIPFFPGVIYLGVFSYIVSVLWIITIINAINLIDGIDGLAAGIIIISSLSMTIMLIFSGQLLYAIFLIFLIFPMVGFLPFNRFPSKILMGDSGSLFAGVILSTVSIKTSFKASLGIIILVPLGILAIPLIDTVLAFIRRLLEGKNPFSPDHSHIHHKLLEKGFSEVKAANLLILLSMVCSILGVTAYFISKNARVGIFIFLLFIIFSFLYYLGYFTLNGVIKISRKSKKY